MNWINPPAFVRRFSLQQILQHTAAVILGLVLVVSALLPGSAGKVHPVAGLAAGILLVLHFFSLLVIGVRHDVASEHIAFLPFGGSESEAGGNSGKYSAAERWDYFLILGWSILVAASGIALEWPGKVGVPGPYAFSWLRILHAALGASWLLHLLGCHVSFRFLDALPGSRWAIFTGKVPLEAAERRAGWVETLVSSGVLVPVPVESVRETEKETVQVRELLEEGNRLTREARYEDAAAVFEKALALYPEYSQARFNLAVARTRQGRTDLAAEHFRLFLETDPFNPMAGKARELLDGLAANGKEGGK